MGIVDDAEAAVALADDFEAALDAFQPGQRREDALGIFARRDGKPGGDERVLHLIAADQRQFDGYLVSPPASTSEPLRKPGGFGARRA